MTGAIALGIAAGLGVLGIVTALLPRRQPLVVSLRILDSDPATPEGGTMSSRTRESGGIVGPSPVGTRANIRAWLGWRATSTMRQFPSVGEKLRVDLACAECDIGTLAEQCALAALAGAFVPFVAWALLVLRGVDTPLTLPVWVGVLGASGGARVPWS